MRSCKSVPYFCEQAAISFQILTQSDRQTNRHSHTRTHTHGYMRTDTQTHTHTEREREKFPKTVLFCTL